MWIKSRAQGASWGSTNWDCQFIFLELAQDEDGDKILFSNKICDLKQYISKTTLIVGAPCDIPAIFYCNFKDNLQIVLLFLIRV